MYIKRSLEELSWEKWMEHRRRSLDQTKRVKQVELEREKRSLWMELRKRSLDQMQGM